MYFPPPPCSLLWRSCEWHRGRGVCSCWVIHSFLPLFVPAWVCLLLWLKISRHQVSWRLEFSPSSVHLLPALPLGKGPQPGLTAHSLPQWCLGLHLGLLGSWRCRLAVTELSGRYLACWGPPVAPHLWASCYSGDTFSFCPHWPFCHLLSRPGDSALQPHRDPFFFFFSLSWTLVPSSSPFELLGGSTVRLLSPSQSQGAEYRAVSTPRGCPSAPAHWPLCLTLKPWQPSSAISPLLHSLLLLSYPRFPPNQHQMSCDSSQ